MAIVWSVTVFLSAFLLFLVQPMMAKMILPMLGGTPAVWNTCMLFYQATLLAGYGYVHLLSSRVDPRRQLVIHLALLALPLLLLPIGLPAGWTPPDETNPVFWVLLLLTVAIGLPFFVLSTTAPLLQKWFSWTDHRSAKDPYFLYAASNAGSMLGLLSYPFVIEPWLPLRGADQLTQTLLWSFGYGALVLLILVCAWFVRSTHKSRGTEAAADMGQQAIAPLSPVSTGLLVRWVLLAFIPSSMLLGATTHITLNVAAIPLLWVVPLSLYLLSFIIVFAKWPAANHRAMVLVLPLVLLLMAFDMMPNAPALSYWMKLFLPLAGLGVVAMVCHGELARTRPPTDRLTLFYLLMSVGGALGGLFNALIAPVVFTDIYEYEIVMVLACFILPSLLEKDPLWTARWSPYRWSVGKGQAGDWAWVLGVALVTGLFMWFIRPLKDPAFLLVMVCTGLPFLLCYAAVGRPVRLGLSLAAVLVMANTVSAWFGAPVLYQTRTFFGVLKVEYTKENNTRQLVHGTTNHGIQRVEPEFRRESVSYFHPTGPYGQVFAAFSGSKAKKNIAVTGLGIAALANYCEQGQSLTYYEIDPAVVTIAQDPQLFTYYDDATARGVALRVVVGDARLKMEDAPDAGYDMIIMDAFTSDAIPVHLLTREAMEMYLRKLAPGGLLVTHISNRYLALEPVLGNLAEALGLVALKQFDFANGVPFKSGADLVVMAREVEALGPLATDPRWSPVDRVPSVGTWSDDFSNVVSIIKWGI
ncbi:MAG: fused MFS/spermidine synthase [Nitrospirota bacterium]|nr:fused MFS/spermidine synthase [Nitrospirota bacterium]MDP2384600.1 fused MFS/spermidine synthase [Nitrospirota bacterium]